MIDFKRLDHIQICIPKGKENEARHFYSDIIGLSETAKPGSLIANGDLWYKIADIQLHIGIENEMNNSKRHPAFEVSNLDESRNYFVAGGVSLKDEIQTPGQKRFSFFDAFGNRIELLQKT